MSFPNVTAMFALGLLLLIISLVLLLSIFVNLNSYAESDHNNKNNENKSSLSPFPSPPISDIKEHKKSKALIDANTSSFLSSSPPSTSDSSNETSNDKSQVGTLVVTKQVINDGGGTKSPSDFIITVNGNNPTPSSFRGSSSGTIIELSKGKYEVTESGSTTNYNSTLSNGCSGTINVGENKECTIINTYSASPPPPITTGKIIVIKKVINDGGGTKSPSDFIITVNGNNPTPSSFAGSSSGTTITINKGRYNVTEQGSDISNDYVPGFYTPNYSSDCAGTIKGGDTVSCTITNKYNPFIPGILTKLIVTKQVINDGGGTKSPSDFIITVNGNNPTPSSFAGSSSGTTVSLKPGSYSVTETGPPGYTADYSDACNDSAKVGSINKCTITNTFQPVPESAQLIIIKNIINNNNDSHGPVVKPSAFTITVHGNNPLPRSFPGKSGGGVIVNLEPGRYSVTEEGPSGYKTDYSASCQGSISSGEAKACIITNEAIMPPKPTPPTPIPNKPLLPVTETIKGFSAPYGIALNIDNDLIYVSNYGQINTTGTVSVINSTTNTIVATIPVDKNPQAIAYNPANGLLYVANMLSGTLSIINGTSNSLIGSMPLGDYPGKSPTGIAVNPINNTIYVTNMGSNTVSVINGTSNVVIDNITSSAAGNLFSPAGIAYDSDNNKIYVTNRGSDTVSVINGTTDTLIDEISIDAIAPSGIVYNTLNNYIYVTNMGSNTVSVINGTSDALVETIPIGLGPNGIVHNQNNGNVYVANSLNGTISVINGLTNTVNTTFLIGINNNPTGILYNPSNDTIFTTNTNSNTLSVIKNQ